MRRCLKDVKRHKGRHPARMNLRPAPHIRARFIFRGGAHNLCGGSADRLRRRECSQRDTTSIEIPTARRFTVAGARGERLAYRNLRDAWASQARARTLRRLFAGLDSP